MKVVKKVCVMIVVIKKVVKTVIHQNPIQISTSTKTVKCIDSTCIQCFNKKVRCEFCNKELNKNYLRSHVKKQHLYQHYNQDDKHTTVQLRDSFRTQLCDSSRDSSHTNINTGGDLLPTRQLSRKLPQLRDSYHT